MTWESGPFPGDGAVKALVWKNEGATTRRLAQITLTVTPDLVPRFATFSRLSDRMVLHHEGWSPSRERPIRFLPVDPIIKPGDGLVWRYRAWSPEPVSMTADVEWQHE